MSEKKSISVPLDQSDVPLEDMQVTGRAFLEGLATMAAQIMAIRQALVSLGISQEAMDQTIRECHRLASV